jgi:hypothetical protein
MASISLPRIPRWGKSAARLPGARGPPPSSGRGLRTLVYAGPVHGAPAHGLRKRDYTLRAHGT